MRSHPLKPGCRRRPTSPIPSRKVIHKGYCNGALLRYAQLRICLKTLKTRRWLRAGDNEKREPGNVGELPGVLAYGLKMSDLFAVDCLL